jgi:hypothetical protein
MLGDLARVNQCAMRKALSGLPTFAGDFKFVFAVVQDYPAHQPPHNGADSFLSTEICISDQQPFIGKACFHFIEADRFHFVLLFTTLNRLRAKAKNGKQN